ncbi:MAG: hypothetical protein EUB_01560 [Eubacterium sp.]|uniref:hypothetical protein n=1 Tax=Eubacterium sp. TaxID=142586 RepID=UPI003039F057
MNFNEVMGNEAIGKQAEEIVKAASVSWFEFGVCVGVAFVAGGFTCKYVVEPAVAKFKIGQKEKQEKTEEGIEDAEIVDIMDSNEIQFDK